MILINELRKEINCHSLSDSDQPCCSDSIAPPLSQTLCPRRRTCLTNPLPIIFLNVVQNSTFHTYKISLKKLVKTLNASWVWTQNKLLLSVQQAVHPTNCWTPSKLPGHPTSCLAFNTSVESQSGLDIQQVVSPPTPPKTMNSRQQLPLHSYSTSLFWLHSYYCFFLICFYHSVRWVCRPTWMTPMTWLWGWVPHQLLVSSGTPDLCISNVLLTCHFCKSISTSSLIMNHFLRR